MRLVLDFTPTPPEKMRYRTSGDWRETPTGFEIEVVDCGNWRTEVAIVLHELVEACLCKNAVITADTVDAYDFSHQDNDEAGDNLDAPYHMQHEVALRVEREMTDALGLDWESHNDALDAAWERIPTFVPSDPTTT